MWYRQKSLLLASVALFVWPAAAVAQEGGFMLEEESEKEPVRITTTTVEAGAGYVNDDSFKFGEYNGLAEDGSFFIGNIESYLRPPYDNEEGDTGYFELRANNLGLYSRSLEMETGKQGKYALFLEYDQIPHYRFDDGQTPFIGAGGTELALPPDWVLGSETDDLTALDASLRPLEVKTERERIGAGFEVDLTKKWKLSTSFRTEEKTGIETIAGLFGTSGGSFRASILPKPIDYTTHSAELNLGYSSDRLQLQVGYDLSVFENDKDSLTWENPYTSFQPATNDGEGRMALEPDNSAHHLSLSGGYIVSPETRVTGSVSVGRMIQDDSFLPYTIRSDLAVPEDLPRDSLDGEVNTIHASVGVSTDLTDSIDFRAQYKFDDRDNNTPIDTYLTVPNDSADQALIDEDRARVNKPYSKRSHDIEAEVGYDLTADTKLGVGYEFERVHRELQEVDNTDEHTGRIKLRSRLTDTLTGRLEYAYARRTGSTYETTAPFLAGHSDDYLATIVLPDDAYEQNPYLRKFYMADRNQHRVSGGLSMFPTDQLTLGLSGSYRLSDYDESVLGLTESSYGSATFDASYVSMNNVELLGFLTYETMENVQVGYQRVGGTDILPGDPLLDLGGPPPTQGLWEETTDDQALTAGIEIKWTAIEDTLDLGIDYAFSKTKTDYTFATNLDGIEPLPDLKTTLNSIGLRADYSVTDDLVLRFGYRFEKYDVEDFALDGVDEVIAPRVFALGNGSPDYDVHLIAVSAVRKF